LVSSEGNSVAAVAIGIPLGLLAATRSRSERSSRAGPHTPAAEILRAE
jgi:hypothetical protein